MKAAALREMSTDELRGRVQELREQLLKLRFQKSTGQLENPQMIKNVKRDLARTLTVLRQLTGEAGGGGPATASEAAGAEGRA